MYLALKSIWFQSISTDDIQLKANKSNQIWLKGKNEKMNK